MTSLEHPNVEHAHVIKTGFNTPAYQVELRRMHIVGSIQNIDQSNNRIVWEKDTEGRVSYLTPGVYDIERLCKEIENLFYDEWHSNLIHLVQNDGGVVEFWKEGVSSASIFANTFSDEPQYTSPMLMRMLGHQGYEITFTDGHQWMGRPAGHFMGSDLIYVCIPEITNPTQCFVNSDIPPPVAIFPFNFGQDVHTYEIGTSPSFIYTSSDMPFDISQLTVYLFKVNMIFGTRIWLGVEEGGMTLNFRVAV